MFLKQLIVMIFLLGIAILTLHGYFLDSVNGGGGWGWVRLYFFWLPAVEGGGESLYLHFDR